MNGTQPQMLPQPKKSSSILWIVIVVIAVIALLVAFYYFYFYTPPEESANLPQGTTQGASDEVAAIERDLTAIDLEGLDKELGDIEKELAQ